jgi:D-beta-D-heptose 7-phosphate kinase/D-beta-D-heptose 1-phosphate adenosyltransferase
MQNKYQKFISSFGKRKVLVLGDFIVDTYIKGDIKRIAPEVPVPVLDVQSKAVQLGGAANVALNLKALSAQVVFCSVVGNDEAGRQGLALLKGSGITTESILISRHKSTQAKTRVMAGLQAVVRYDTGDTEPINAEMEQRIISFFRENWKLFDALLLADYDKGVITDAILRCIARLQKAHPIFIAVDSKRPAYFKPLYPDLVKPNFEEAQKLLGITVSVKEDREKRLEDYGPQPHRPSGRLKMPFSVSLRYLLQPFPCRERC